MTNPPKCRTCQKRLSAVVLLALFFTSSIRAVESPLPDDPILAEWTKKIESIFYAYHELMNCCGEPGEDPKDAEQFSKTALAQWELITKADLPKNDILRGRAARAVARLLQSRGDYAAAAKFAEEQGLADFAAAFYNQAKLENEAKRFYPALEKSMKDHDEFKKAHAPKIVNGQYDGWEDPPKTTSSWLEFLTTGIDDPWTRQCNRGFQSFAKHLPDNARLWRALTLYYTPCVEDNFNSIDGELDIFEPVLRLTARAFPDDLAKTYEMMVRPNLSTSSEKPSFRQWRPPNRIPGDLGPTGNALRLMHDLLKDAPAARLAILEAIKQQIDHHKGSVYRARWMALRSYIEDGFPDPGKDWKSMIIPKLNGSDDERRWALGWIPCMLLEHAPEHYPQFKDADLAKAVADAAMKCRSAEDTILAVDVLALMPPLCGKEVIFKAEEDQDEHVAGAALGAFWCQFIRRCWDCPHDDRGYVTESPKDLVAELPNLRKAFYKFLTKPQLCHEVVTIFATLSDEQLDDKIAACLSKIDANNSTFMQTVAVACSEYPKCGWLKTVAAFESLGTRKDFAHAEYAARLAKEIRSEIDRRRTK